MDSVLTLVHQQQRDHTFQASNVVYRWMLLFRPNDRWISLEVIELVLSQLLTGVLYALNFEIAAFASLCSRHFKLPTGQGMHRSCLSTSSDVQPPKSATSDRPGPAMFLAAKTAICPSSSCGMKIYSHTPPCDGCVNDWCPFVATR